MKDISLLTWVTQLGLSVAVPLAGFVVLAVWIRDHLSLGNWVLWLGIGLGILSAINGFVQSLKAMSRMSAEKKQNKDLPISYHDHD